MKTRNLTTFTIIVMIVVILAAYGLALLRTYLLKPSPASASHPPTTISALILPEDC
jgi:hypothetical protein